MSKVSYGQKKSTSGQDQVGNIFKQRARNKSRAIIPFSKIKIKKRDSYLQRLVKKHKIIIPRGLTSASADYIVTNPDSINNMYGSSDLSSRPIFSGGIINFGYWEGINLKQPLTIESRTASGFLMYNLVAEKAKIIDGSSVLEVGCGTGLGAKFVCERYNVSYTGIDATPAQVKRAVDNNKSTASIIKFKHGFAEDLGQFQDSKFDHVISVEAAQHFPDIGEFINESNRVLKKAGKLTMVSFFATNKAGVDAIKELIPDYKNHCSLVTAEKITESLRKNFTNVSCKSIGSNVWAGLGAWLKAIRYEKQWTNLWIIMYNAGLIDYYLFEASMPLSNSHNPRRSDRLASMPLKKCDDSAISDVSPRRSGRNAGQEIQALKI